MTIGYCKIIQDYTEATGVMPLLYSIRDCIPIAFPALLFVIFFIFFAGTYYLIKGKTGRAKVLISILASSFYVVILAMFLLLGTLISYKLLLFWTFICIISFIALILSDRY